MDLTELILDIAKQGPLVGLLLYIMIRNQRLLDEKDTTIGSLHKEMREMQDRNFTRLESIKKDSDTVLNSLREAFKG